MAQYSVYVNRGDEKQVVKEELDVFIRSVLDSIEGVDVSEFWKKEEPLTVDIKVKLRKFLAKYGISIINDGDGGCIVCIGSGHDSDEVIAEWKRPKFLLRKDETALSLDKKIYYEIIFEYWTCFDEE